MGIPYPLSQDLESATDSENGNGHVAAAWLQQQRIHVRMGLDSLCLGLLRLGPADFRAFRSDPGIQGHVLGLERGCKGRWGLLVGLAPIPKGTVVGWARGPDPATAGFPMPTLTTYNPGRSPCASQTAEP